MASMSIYQPSVNLRNSMQDYADNYGDNPNYYNNNNISNNESNNSTNQNSTPVNNTSTNNLNSINNSLKESNQNISGNNNNSHNNSQNKDNSRKSRRVTFYKNGDRYFLGKLVTITPNRYFSFKDLMNDLNRSVDLPYGVRRVYTPVHGREIYDIDDLVDGSSYVCASFEPFRPTKYGDTHEKPWNSNMGMLFLKLILNMNINFFLIFVNLNKYVYY